MKKLSKAELEEEDYSEENLDSKPEALQDQFHIEQFDNQNTESQDSEKVIVQSLEIIKVQENFSCKDNHVEEIQVQRLIETESLTQ